MGTNGSLTLDVQERVGGSSPKSVGGLSLGSANQRLTLRAKACLERLAAIEVSCLSFVIEIRKTGITSSALLLTQARIQEFSSQAGNKLLHRIQTLQDLILEFRRQVKSRYSIQTKEHHADSPTSASPLQHLDSPLLVDLTSVGLGAAQWVEDFLDRRGGGGGVAPLWQNGPLHRFVTETLPRFLGLLQHASLLGQQELRSESRETVPRIQRFSISLNHSKDDGLE